MKKLITLLALLATTSILADRVVCHNPFDDNSITIKTAYNQQGKFLNGKIELKGYKLRTFFEHELAAKEINAQETWYGGGGRSHSVKAFSAHVNASHYYAERINSEGTGFKVFADFGGIKIVAFEDGRSNGKDWWFKKCNYSKY
ncbi:MAG: hypothetical protein GY909_18875 [Oligoflexia bacterium]|nr:hypothetical protein [Oligoflexia bacterium]